MESSYNHRLSVIEKLLNPKKRQITMYILVILLMMMGSTLLVYLTGGIKFVFSHTMYVPITLAALLFYAPGGILAALLGGLILGPFMPVDIATGEMQTTLNWITRICIFVIVGGFEGMTTKMLSTQILKFRWLAQHDQESGLPNRAYLVNQLEMLISQSSPARQYGVLILHINNYGDIANTFGTEITKSLIEQMAEKLRPYLQGSPVCLLLPHLIGVVIFGSDLQNRERIQSIIQLTQEPINLDDLPVFIDVHIGSAFYPQVSEIPVVLVRKAIIAAHSGIEKGLNYHPYDYRVDRYSKQRLALIGAVPKAIEENQFVLHYQPIFNLQNGRTCGMEALIRWQHPDDGLIPPDQFIPHLENTSLIYPLQRWVVETAIKDSLVTTREAPNTRLAINMSARTLNNPQLPLMLESLVSTYKVNPVDMVLEITETALMLEMQRITEFLHTLHRIGFRIAVDDFGRGFSSLAYLRSLPVDYLKLDRDFIKDLRESEKDKEITRAALALAKALKLETIAEGVENQETYEWLKAEGCDYAQGYYMSKPLPIERAVQFFHHNGSSPHR